MTVLRKKTPERCLVFVIRNVFSSKQLVNNGLLFCLFYLQYHNNGILKLQTKSSLYSIACRAFDNSNYGNTDLIDNGPCGPKHFGGS